MVRQGAHFSEDRNYRYALWRIWNPDKPLVMFIGLNPSTANERTNDPTIKRVMKLAGGWGYGGFYMMNLFAIVSSDPAVLVNHPDPLGENDYWLEKIAIECETIVFAWGAFKEARARAEVVAKMFAGALCLRKTKDGHPWHPLYIPANTKPSPFTPN
jgi:hypothetical protein